MDFENERVLSSRTAKSWESLQPVVPFEPGEETDCGPPPADSLASLSIIALLCSFFSGFADSRVGKVASIAARFLLR